MTPTLARIENVALNEGFADNDNCEDAVILSGLVADNLYESGGAGVGFTIANFDDCDIYGNVRAVHDLTVCGIATLEDTTAKGPETWNAGLQGFEVRDALTSFRGATFNARLLLDIATGQAPAEVLVSADDTTDVLTYPGAPVAIVTGTGVLYWVQLPDATTCLVGCRREIVNASPEFVGLKNSSSATWHRVPPRAKCVCYLLDNSTAAGVWFSEVIESTDPSDGVSCFNDFLTGIASAAVPGCITPVAIQGGGGGSSVTSGAFGNSDGIFRHYCIAVNDFSGCRCGSGFKDFGATFGASAVELCFYFQQLSTAAEEFIFRAGVGDNVAGGAHTRGVYFLYDRAANGDFWVLRNINAAGNETIVTATAVNTNKNKIRLEIASDGSRSDFFVNKTQISPAGGLTTFLPTNGAYDFVETCVKTVGANVVSQYCDFLKIQNCVNVRR